MAPFWCHYTQHDNYNQALLNNREMRQTLSIWKLDAYPMCHYADCHLCWVSWLLHFPFR